MNNISNMRSQVAELYPELEPAQIKHICNLASNYLRSLKMDIWGVEVANMPFNQAADGCHYHVYHEITECGVVLFIKVTVD